MKKPREIDCRKLCEEYESCNATWCARRKGSYADTPRKIVMMTAQETYKWNSNMAMRLYREVPDLTDNGNNLRKKLI